jgi:hypothetical protein
MENIDKSNTENPRLGDADGRTDYCKKWRCQPKREITQRWRRENPHHSTGLLEARYICSFSVVVWTSPAESFLASGPARQMTIFLSLTTPGRLEQRSPNEGPRKTFCGPWRNLDIIWNCYVYDTVSLHCDMHACLRPLLSNRPRSTVNSGTAC